jgi:hypothetical protein
MTRRAGSLAHAKMASDPLLRVLLWRRGVELRFFDGYEYI